MYMTGKIHSKFDSKNIENSYFVANNTFNKFILQFINFVNIGWLKEVGYSICVDI